jgi:hypothetical protein
MPVPGNAVGTSYRDTNLPQSVQLFNTYSQHHISDGCIRQQLVRHSVVDTRHRADMLLSLLRQMDTASNKRVRMLCLLTRRQGDEEDLWQRQQEQVAYMKERLATDGVQLAPLSFQANANCHYNFWNQGESANATSNAGAWLQYLEWLLRDLLQFAEQQKLCDRLKRQLQDSLGRVLSSISEPHKPQDRTSWFFSRVSLSEQVPTLYLLLRRMANHTLPSLNQAIQIHYQGLGILVPDEGRALLYALETLCRLVRSQYPPTSDGDGDGGKHHNDSKPLSRVSEFLSLAFLDRLLGVVSCLNCKSGCDRSGLVHALSTALNLLVDSHPNPWDTKVFAAVCFDFDVLVENVDEYTQTPEQFVASLAQWELCKRGDVDRAMSFVSELRNWTFVVLMDIGWRINIHSTGLTGLKFHLGSVSANPHVVSVLPPFVLGKLDHTIPGLQAIPVHRKLNLDRRFADFLNGASQYRGA